MIKPVGSDIGRRVVLELFGEKPVFGTLTDVRGPDIRNYTEPYAMVNFEDGVRCACVLSKLKWADKCPHSPGEAPYSAKTDPDEPCLPL